MPGDLGLARYVDCVAVVPISGFSVHKQNSKFVLGGNPHQVQVYRVRTTRHRARTTRGDLLARPVSGIKLNKRLIRIFSFDMCFC